MFSKILQALFGSPQNKNNSNNATLSINVNGKTFSKNKPCVIPKNEPDSPQPFGYKCAWIAVKKASPEIIAEKLNISNLQISNWSSGIDTVYNVDGTVYISPILDDWTLVISLSLPDPGDTRHPNKIKEVLEFLSKEFDEIQYFCSHRVAEYHCWAKANNGKITRAYCYCGEQGTTLWNEGEKSQEEIDLDFNFFDENSVEAQSDDAYWDRETFRYPDEEDVMQISKKWSIDTSFESKTFPTATGFIGTIK